MSPFKQPQVKTDYTLINSTCHGLSLSPHICTHSTKHKAHCLIIIREDKCLCPGWGGWCNSGHTETCHSSISGHVFMSWHFTVTETLSVNWSQQGELKIGSVSPGGFPLVYPAWWIRLIINPLSNLNFNIFQKKKTNLKTHRHHNASQA